MTVSHLIYKGSWANDDHRLPVGPSCSCATTSTSSCVPTNSAESLGLLPVTVPVVDGLIVRRRIPRRSRWCRCGCCGGDSLCCCCRCGRWSRSQRWTRTLSGNWGKRMQMRGNRVRLRRIVVAVVVPVTVNYCPGIVLKCLMLTLSVRCWWRCNWRIGPTSLWCAELVLVTAPGCATIDAPFW